MPSCTICTHNQRQEIEAASLNGASERTIAKQYGVTSAAVHRHKSKHLPEAMVKSQQAREAARADDLLAKVRDLEAEARRIGGKAEASGDYRTAISAVRELVRIVELQARLIGELQEGVTVNIAVNPQWLQIKAVILETLREHHDLRARLAEKLEVMNV